MKRSVVLISVVMIVVCFLATPCWSLESDYYGIYTGEYTGDDQGVWVAYFNAGGAAWLSYSTANRYGDGGRGSLGVEGAGSIPFSAWNMDADTYGSGTILLDGTVTGDWINYWENPNETGDFTGNKVLSCSQQGEYSGSFSGDQSGTWSMTVGADGHITGTMRDDEGNYSFEGGINPGTGYFVVIGNSPGGEYIVSGSVDSDGDVSGEWHTEGDDYSGTISNGSGGSSSGGGGGGGGGGCFMSAIVR